MSEIWSQKDRLDNTKNRITQEEWNAIAKENENFLLGSGVNQEDLDTSNENRTSMLKALNQSVLQRQFFNAIGVNDYILTPQIYNSTVILPIDFTKPIMCSFLIPSDNTGVSTITIQDSTLSTKEIVDINGTSITSGTLIAGSFVSVIWSPSLDKWKITYNANEFVKIKNNLLTSSNKKFSVNSGLLSSDAPAFITILSNSQIQVYADATNPLIYTFAGGAQKKDTSNADVSVLQNGNYCVIKSDSGSSLVPLILSLIGNIITGIATLYNLLNISTRGTATITSASATITSVAGVDWTQVAVGNRVSGVGIATSFTSTATRASGSPTLTSLTLSTAEWAKISIGQKISGTGIPTNAYITDFNQTASTITMSANATANGTAVSLTLNYTPKIVSYNTVNSTIVLDTNATTSGTAIAINVYQAADLTVFKAGMPITGTGVATSATISSIDSTNNTITMSAVATASTDLLAITATQTGIYESNTQPTSPLDGELWVRMNPLKTFKYSSSTWSDYSFVQLGKITKSNGVIGTPTCYALNGIHISKQTSFTYGTSIDISHNLGVKSYLISESIFVVNVKSEYEYQPGETLMGAINYNASTDAGTISMYSLRSALLGTCISRFTPSALTANAGIRGFYRNSVLYTAAITPDNWVLVFVYSRNY